MVTFENRLFIASGNLGMFERQMGVASVGVIEVLI